MATKMVIAHKDALAKKFNENLYANHTISEIKNSTTLANMYDTAVRNIIGLTTNSYDDTTFIESKTLTEIIAEQEE